MLKKISILLILLLPFFVKANIRLPYFFSDGMVLQRTSTPAVWGWSDTKKTVTITTSWDKKKYTTQPDANGKWKVALKTMDAGGPYNITISDGSTVTLKNILLGDVWLCSGQSNMEMPLKGFKDQPIANANQIAFESDNNNIRLFTVPRSTVTTARDTCKQAEWKIANPADVYNFSATAYIFGKKIYDKTKVPIGLVCISYGGTPVESFMDEASLADYKKELEFLPVDAKKVTNKYPTTVYNGMLHPFIGYGIKGAIWYQGETNVDREQQYERLFPDFVKMLRTQFAQGDFPFYYVQIAPWDYNQYKKDTEPRSNSALLRDAQRKALAKIPNSGMAVTMDIGHKTYIHPWDKTTVSNRLVLMALKKTYGYKGFASDSPLFESVNYKSDTAVVSFTNAPNGLTSYGQPIVNFEIAGADKIFYPALAAIKNGRIELCAKEVKQPVAVRYAFKDYVEGELFNTEGFPASTFRTDDW